MQSVTGVALVVCQLFFFFFLAVSMLCVTSIILNMQFCVLPLCIHTFHVESFLLMASPRGLGKAEDIRWPGEGRRREGER